MSSGVVVYPLLIIAAGLWSRVRLVWWTTAFAEAAYTALLLDASLRRQAHGSRQQHQHRRGSPGGHGLRGRQTRQSDPGDQLLLRTTSHTEMKARLPARAPRHEILPDRSAVGGRPIEAVEPYGRGLPRRVRGDSPCGARSARRFPAAICPAASITRWRAAMVSGEGLKLPGRWPPAIDQRRPPVLVLAVPDLDLGSLIGEGPAPTLGEVLVGRAVHRRFAFVVDRVHVVAERGARASTVSTASSPPPSVPASSSGSEGAQPGGGHQGCAVQGALRAAGEGRAPCRTSAFM